MFTGLIADLGCVRSIERDGDFATLTIQTRLAASLAPGDSIAVDGVCLTATDVSASQETFAAEAMASTLRRCALNEVQAGRRINLELALRADGRLGGHVVQGHVDGTGTVVELRDESPIADRPVRVLAIETDTSALRRYFVERGSVAVNGVSLTVSALLEDGFEVSLIPETLHRTNLGDLVVGDRVNLEADVLAKHIERLMEARV